MDDKVKAALARWRADDYSDRGRDELEFHEDSQRGEDRQTLADAFAALYDETPATLEFAESIGLTTAQNDYWRWIKCSDGIHLAISKKGVCQIGRESDDYEQEMVELKSITRGQLRMFVAALGGIAGTTTEGG